MRILLAAPLTASHIGVIHGENDLNRFLAQDSPLGVLTLAAILERLRVDFELVQTTQWVYQAFRDFPGRDPAEAVAQRIAGRDFDLLGLSTICSSYPLTLRIASEVKRLRPGSTIVLGGPQATATDVATMKAFPAVDMVLRGEADGTFPQVLEALSSHGRLELIQGITYRTSSGFARNGNAPPVMDLDALPLPAFHLLAGADQARRLPLELGRGCPFSCTFCSTNDFFRRKFRLKSSSVMIAQMTQVQSAYPAVEEFDLTHDMFTVDRRRVADFCHTLLHSGKKFNWNCSARTDSVDEELLALMAQAGCKGVFFGVETGSPRMQKIIDKELDIEQAWQAIRCSGKNGIRVTVATIVGFPEEEEDDLRATLNLLIDAAAHRHVATQLTLLSPLAGTPIYQKHRDRLEFDSCFSDFCQQGYPQTAAEIRLIRNHADVFQSFYAVPTRLPRSLLQEGALFFSWALLRCRWLAIALARELGDPLTMCREWLDFRTPAGAPFAYYCSSAFHRDFVRFANTVKEPSPALRIIVSVQTKLADLSDSERIGNSPGNCIDPDSVPAIARGVTLFTAPGDPDQAVDCMLQQRPLPVSAQIPTALVSQRDEYETKIFRIPPETERMLSLCAARRPALAIALTMKEQFGTPLNDCDAVTAWLAALECLRRDRLIEVAECLP